MPIYDSWVDTFAWHGTVYGAGTTVILKDEFISKFRWNGQEISKEGTFSNIVNGQYQFLRHCPGVQYEDIYRYAFAFSLTELELQNAIEGIGPGAIEVIQTFASKPPDAERQLAKDYEGVVCFFKYKDVYCGKGTKIYLTNEFIDDFYDRTGKRLTKKVSFFFHCLDKDTGERHYKVRHCVDMEIDGYDYKHVISLTEQDFFDAIECIIEPYAIKCSGKYNLTELILLAIFLIIIIKLSFIIFVNPSGIILLCLWIFWKVKNIITYR